MHELPECFVCAKQLKHELQGKSIIDVITNQHPHKFAFYFNDNPNTYASLLLGKTVLDVQSFGSQIEFFLEGVRIDLWDGVNISYVKSKSEIPLKHQLLLHFSDNSYLVCSVQMYGGLWVFKEGENEHYYYQVARERPSPLTEEFNKDYFYSLSQNVPQTMSLKAFLATEQRIPGLGNGVLHDILFNAKLNPKRKLNSLSKEEFDSLLDSVKTTLYEMKVQGGRDIEKDIYGNNGNYQTILSNKTKDQPCPKCQNKIIKEAYLGGSVYYCSHCQK